MKTVFKIVGGFFLYLLIAIPGNAIFSKDALAEQCDPLQFNQGGEHVVWNFFGPGQLSCPGDECANSYVSTIVGYAVWCWPKGVTGFEPSCRAGYDIPKDPMSPTRTLDMRCLGDTPCCQSAEVFGKAVAGCKAKSETPAILLDQFSCTNVKQYAASLAPKDNCLDLTTKYDSTTKKCVKFVENSWQLIYTCGEKDDKGQFTGVGTAIGCIPTGSFDKFLGFLLKWAFGVSGGIIFLMFIVTGYNILTSSGNPEKLQAAKENVVSIFSGLILIVFSLILLQAVGAGILQLPTF